MSDRLALLGGTPVRARWRGARPLSERDRHLPGAAEQPHGRLRATAAFPSWPPVTDSAVGAVARVVESGVWGDVNGPLKTRFEREFAGYHDARYGLAVNNGTVSLEIALRALGIGHGDEVVVPAYTFLATATAVLAVNALPVFTDLDPKTGCLDPDAVEAVLSPRTKAVMPVHLGGHPADLDRFVELTQEHGLALVEDAAHAVGARWNGRGVGSYGHFGSWSFQASKNMTSGEGGILTTNDPALEDAAWSIHNCGRTRDGAWYEHARFGGNYRLTELQAALLLDQLGRLEDDVTTRERAAAKIDSALSTIDGVDPLVRDPRCTSHGYHLYQFAFDAERFGGITRERFVEALQAEGIPSSAGYVLPLDQQGVFVNRTFDQAATGWSEANPRTRYGELDLPVTARFCRDLVWIPQTVLLGSDADIDDVIEAINKISQSVDALRASR